MPMAQVIHELGPPDVMQWQEWPVDDPGPGEVRVRQGICYAFMRQIMTLMKRLTLMNGSITPLFTLFVNK